MLLPSADKAYAVWPADRPAASQQDVVRSCPVPVTLITGEHPVGNLLYQQVAAPLH